MKIQWLGHACFYIESSKGTKILTDPFDASVGYKTDFPSVDILFCSHEHFDHCAVNLVTGKPLVIKTPGNHQMKGITASGLQVFHDEANGSKRGKNIIFTIQVDEIKITHLGDLGHTLTQEQYNKLSGTNVLLCPVGGFFTIDAVQAKKIADTLKPNIVIPMHYKTSVMGANFPIDNEKKFINSFSNVEKFAEKTLEISKDKLPAPTKVIVLKY